MKALFKLLIIPVFAAVAIVGCGDKKNNNNPYAGLPYGQFGQIGPNGQLTGNSFEGSTQIVNGNLYQQYLDEANRCNRDRNIFNWFNTCKFIDGAPYIKITFLSQSVLEYYGLPARIEMLGSSSGNGVYTTPGQQTSFFPAANDNGEEFLEANYQSNTGNVRIQIKGQPTDNKVSIDLLYRNEVMARAELFRRVYYPQPGYPGGGYQPGYPGYQPGYPNQYPYGY